MQSNVLEPRGRVFVVEKITSKTNEEHKLCVKEEYFYGPGLESILDNEKDWVHIIFDGSTCCIFCVK